MHCSIRFSCLLWLVFLLASCSSEAPPADEPQPSPPREATALVVNIDGLRLRDAPGEDGRVIRELSRGDVLYDLGEVSSFTTPIRLRGIQFDEPWLKVAAADRAEGWVYGGALHFTMRQPTELAQLLMRKRLQTFFGPDKAGSIEHYRQAFYAIEHTEDFVRLFRRGQSLRDTLVAMLESRIEVGPVEQLPDLFWLEEALPGFVPQLVAEGTAYYLFTDFRDFGKVAAATPGREDDAFVSFCLQVFPEDSIEYFFPAWTIQTWDYGGHSLLGRGVHHRLLREMDHLLAASDHFAAELHSIKMDLLNDITRPDVTYWEPQEKVMAEMDSILAADYGFLTPSDRIALRTRREQFAEPEKHGIEFSHQSGIYDR